MEKPFLQSINSARIIAVTFVLPSFCKSRGETVHLRLRVRHLRCQNQQCAQKTFAERFPETLTVHAQRTQRFTATLTLFALALSGQAGARLLDQVGMPTSADTLLRLVKRALAPLTPVLELTHKVRESQLRCQMRCLQGEVATEARDGGMVALKSCLDGIASIYLSYSVLALYRSLLPRSYARKRLFLFTCVQMYTPSFNPPPALLSPWLKSINPCNLLLVLLSAQARRLILRG